MNCIREKYIKNFLTFIINEAKQVGNLYHYTNYNNFRNIVKDNFIFNSHYSHKEFDKPIISFTRDSSGNPFITEMRMVRFTFDGSILSNNYKIIPLIDYKRGYGRKAWHSQKDESETILISTPDKPGYGKSVDLKKYIIRIDIIFNEIYSRTIEEEIEFLKKIDIPIFIHNKTWDSKQEYPINQKNKSRFKRIDDFL